MKNSNFRNITFVFLLLTGWMKAVAQDIVVHDPVVIKAGDEYYLYCTGHGISAFRSPDMKNWEKLPRFFRRNPPGPYCGARL